VKVFQINVDWDSGGPGSIAKGISDAIIAEGGESYIAYGRGKMDSNVHSYKIGSELSEYIDVFEARLFDNAAFGTKKGTIELVNVIKTVNPDIVQLHTLLGYYINIEVLFDFLRKTSIPTIWTIHDCWAFTGHCINFERINCKKWIDGCNHCPYKKEYPKSVLLDRSAQNYAKKKALFFDMKNLTLVSPSLWLAELIKQSFLKYIPLQVIQNGIDLKEYKPTKSNLRNRYHLENKKVLLAVAFMWNQMKGDELLEKIANQLDDSYRIVMIGNKRFIPRDKKIISIPPTSNKDDLRKWYSAADIFINPTLGDNFPTVNIEALACGTPVVTNDTGGSPEIAGNECGKIVYTKSADEFVQKIEDCLDQKIASEKCLARAEQFNADCIYDHYVDLYHSVLVN
jgi:glycosyltransferase involved in cell wall biosynthesis